MSVGIGSSGWQTPLLELGGFDGLIIEAFASGDVPPRTAEILTSLVAKGLPVVLASRARPGLIRPVFPGLIGTSHELLASGFHGAGQLDPHRARMRLAVALSCNHAEQMKSAFVRKKEKGVNRG
jgi:L-asparaginase